MLLQLLLLMLLQLLLQLLQLLSLMPLQLLSLMPLLNASRRWTDSADKCQSSPSVTLPFQDVSLSPSVSLFLSVLLFQDQSVKQSQGMLLPPSATPSQSLSAEPSQFKSQLPPQ